MSETLPENHENPENINAEEFSFDQLEMALSEPHVERVVQQAREFNELINAGPITAQELYDIRNGLDAEWGPLNRASVRISGRILVSDEDIDLAPTYYSVDDQLAYSNGFDITVDTISLDDEGGDEDTIQAYRIVHHMLINFEEALPAVAAMYKERGADVPPWTGVHAELDDISIQPEGMSVERAQAWLETSAPELMSELEIRVLDDVEGEDYALLNLVDFNPNDYADLSDEFTRKCFDRYINSILDFDNEVPYTMSFDGRGRIIESDEEVKNCIVRSDRVAASIHGVSLHPTLKAGLSAHKEDDWELAVSVTVHPSSRQRPETYMVLTADAIKDVQSIRRQIYTDN